MMSSPIDDIYEEMRKSPPVIINQGQKQITKRVGDAIEFYRDGKFIGSMPARQWDEMTKEKQ